MLLSCSIGPRLRELESPKGTPVTAFDPIRRVERLLMAEARLQARQRTADFPRKVVWLNPAGSRRFARDLIPA